jgi:tripeptidyl-peptidase I
LSSLVYLSASHTRQWIQFDTPAATAEDLFLAEYFMWEHASGTDIACDKYHLPRHIQPYVDYVLPGIRMLPRTTKSSAQKRSISIASTFPGLPTLNSSSCSAYVTPACIKNQYGIPNGTTAASGNELGIYSTANEHYSVTDLNEYWQVLWPTIPQGTKPQDNLIDGAVSPANPSATPAIPIGSGETDLDIEMSWPIIWPQKISVFQVDDQWYEFEEGSSHAPSPPNGKYNSELPTTYIIPFPH